jgi:hypothetical protein
MPFNCWRQGRGWVTAQALGKPAQRGLRDAAQFAFAALLAEARKSYPHNRDVHEEAVGAAMQRLLAQPGVADRLLADALTAAELDLPWLEAQFGRQRCGGTTHRHPLRRGPLFQGVARCAGRRAGAGGRRQYHTLPAVAGRQRGCRAGQAGCGRCRDRALSKRSSTN